MILGIITAIVFVLVLSVLFTQKLKSSSPIKRFLAVIHKPLGYLFVTLIIIHLALTLQLINQRPIMIYILGIAMLSCALAGIIVWRCIKNKRKALIWHKICALVLALILIAHITYCVVSLDEYQQKIAEISFSNPQVSSVADGQYIGECDVGYIFVKVKVTVKDGTIIDIQLLDHRNERGKAGEGVVGKMLVQQHTDVDAVSSATNSSKVIKKAVENALEKGLDR